uniref:non-specific serine/threonine protein kinase n=1 Tax=Salix viminalis TaxID=40686 RepID=A0A6N2LWJ9_SALVM
MTLKGKHDSMKHLFCQGKLPDGKEIAVKRLSKPRLKVKRSSKMSLHLQENFNIYSAGILQREEEKMLIYEYMRTRAIYGLYFDVDPIRRYILDWRKRVQIIEGLTQGLLYLQEFSNFTIIHRDIKSSNILLDEDMNLRYQTLVWLGSSGKMNSKQTQEG